MGILKAAALSAMDVAGEQWKEFFYCDSLPEELLLVRGKKHISEHSSNNRTDDSVISTGSIIATADGQCAIVVSQGKVIAVYEEPGEHVFENPDVQGGVKGFLKETGKRISFGGGVQPTSQRVYYCNTKEIMGVPFSGQVPVTLQSGGFQSSLSVAGVFSYRICNPQAFYKMVTGNVAMQYGRSRLNAQLVTELCTALSTAIAKTWIGRMSEIGLHTDDLITELTAEVNAIWREKRGLEAVRIAFDSECFSSAQAISNIQMTEVFADKTERAESTGKTEWTCTCGQKNSGAFCTECGNKKPESWTCSCGQRNEGSFCIECGKARP